jgi:aminoglycoside 3-N-acetyltransferase I
VPVHTARLRSPEVSVAKQLFVLMARVFGEPHVELGVGYVESLLAGDGFWAMAAWVDGKLAGGLTAHALPMTRSEARELFVYDLAVLPAHQRQGIGRALVGSLRAEAARVGITDVFVAADNDDVHALDFYRALGGAAAPVTMFTFGDLARDLG